MKNECYFADDKVYIKLLGKQIDVAYAMVSHEQYDKVAKYDWYMGKSGYAFAYGVQGRKRYTLHKFIFTLCLKNIFPKGCGYCIDHINRNKLDNTDNNLRLATQQENSFNRSSQKQLKNIKGVTKISTNNYCASLTHNGILHKMQNLPTEKEAANMYNIMACEYFGEFASLNVIDN